MPKEIYSQRNNPAKKKWNLNQVLKLFYSIYQDFENKDYFSEYFGWTSSSEDYGDYFNPGKLGYNEDSVKTKVFRMTKKENLYPIWGFYQNYTQEDLFDAIEILHEYCTINSEKLEKINSRRYYTDYQTSELFQEYQETLDIVLPTYAYIPTDLEYFSLYLQQTAQKEFRDEINDILVEYVDGFVLNEKGQIESLKLGGLEQIINAKVPKIEGKLGEIANQKIEAAIKIFRRQGKDMPEKQKAITQIADVLEHFKKDYDVKILSKDENDLFQLANQFAIRHFDLKQKENYPQDLYYSWIFQVFLATFHLWARLIEDKKVVKIVKKSN